MSLKLLYITNGINASAGLERVLSVKASALADNFGYQIGIAVLNNADVEPFYQFSKNVQFFSVEVGGSPISYFQSYRKGMQGIVDQFQPDIICVCDDGLKAFLLPRLIKAKAKWIYERHVSKLIETRTDQAFAQVIATKIKWMLMERLAQKFDRFIVLTEGNRNEWPSLKNIRVIANPLPFSSPEISSQENKIVICVGKISYQKGQDLLLEAWRAVHAKHPEWQLHLYGKENNAFLDTRTLQHNIYYFPPAKDIDQKYREASIYVMASRFEGFGMVLIEAMEFGLPCVSFNCNYGPSDIIEEGVDGLLVEKENIAELADKLMILIENEELRIEMGLRAKQNAQRYAPEAIVKQWDVLFRELAGKNS